MDSPGTCREAYYRNVLTLLERYFAGSDFRKPFLQGGCYWLADFLHRGIRDSRIMINRVEEHCALAFGRGIYDVTGCISARNFHAASERELSFMKKHYVPGFDTAALEQYLQEAFL